MAIVKRTSFAVLLTALLASSVSAQTNIQFDRCLANEDTRIPVTPGNFDDDRDGSLRRTCKL